MGKRILFTIILGVALLAAAGCGKEDTPPPNSSANNSQLPAGHPSLPEGSKPSGKPVDVKEVTDKVTQALDKKFPGEWQSSGTTLKKGSYTENNNFGIADEVANLYQGSMVSIFVGQDRISGTVKGQDGKRVLAGYNVPAKVGETMKSGIASVDNAGSMGSSSYQKVYLPLKSGNKTVAVMTISIAQ